MLNLKKVAVTGGISSGKTTVCSCFKNLGGYIVDADKVVHTLLDPKTDVGEKIIALLGKGVLNEKGFNRKTIAEKVFQNPHLLKNLESLLHPEVKKIIHLKYQKVLQEKKICTLFVVEIPLLFESSYESFFDIKIVVMSDENMCKKRFIKKTSYSKEEYERRSKRLFSLTTKVQQADFVIVNNGTLEELENAIKKIFIKISLKGML